MRQQHEHVVDIDLGHGDLLQRAIGQSTMRKGRRAMRESLEHGRGTGRGGLLEGLAAREHQGDDDGDPPLAQQGRRHQREQAEEIGAERAMGSIADDAPEQRQAYRGRREGEGH